MSNALGIYAIALYWTLVVLTCGGCAARKPGDSWPYVTQSYAEGDVIYQGVGVRF